MARCTFLQISTLIFGCDQVLAVSRKALSNTLALLAVCVALVVGFGGSLVFGKTVTVSVAGLRSDKGVVHLFMYDNAGAFSRASITDLASYEVRPSNGNAVQFTLSGVSSGTYALMVHHDEDRDNTFNMSGQTPLEGWGYSNNVGKAQTPSFESASFVVENSIALSQITINYAN